MKKIALGIAILLFAIVFALCSSGLELFTFGIGVVGLIFSIIGFMEHKWQILIDKGDDFVKKLSEDAEKIMAERFGKDTIIALATVENEVPFVRYVNAYYENGAFYIITYALSNKMRHMESNSTVAIAGEWFTAHGKSINLGYFGKEENYRIAEKLKKVFSEWIDNGHNNFDDENTIILCVELTDGLLLSHGARYEF